ncbi:MAG: hydrolase [Gammaproteobacteria bacterium]|nr:hydrolase [Gammaproteobacteria bacterium]
MSTEIPGESCAAEGNGQTGADAKTGRVVASSFRPAWWLPGPHLPTVWAAVARTAPTVDLEWERLDTPDGDFVDLAWHGPESGPIVLILHGLEGGHASTYTSGMLRAFAARGWRGVLMHFRSCGRDPNRLDQSYHSGAIDDPAFVLETLRQRFPGRPIAANGYSLGGNVLLRLLAEQGKDSMLAAAVAVSVPYQLYTACTRMNRGLSRLYQRRLLNSLKRKYAAKFADGGGPAPVEAVERMTDFFEFDDAVTAPLHGFSGAHDYYRRCSSRPVLNRIARPTLLIHSPDDPFMTPAVIPGAPELAPSVTLELTRGGGHVGFVGGAVPGRGRYWLEQRVPDFIAQYLQTD